MPVVLAALLFSCLSSTSSEPNLPQLMVERPVGVVARSNGETVLRDSDSRDLLKLPSGGKKAEGYISFNVAYDARVHELFVLRSGANSPAKLYRCILSADGFKPRWRTQTLPPRSAVLMRSPRGEEYARADAEGVCFNRQYVFVVYSGPRIRAYDRRTFKPVAESKFDDPMAPSIPASDWLSAFEVADTGLDYSIGISHTQMEDQLPTDVYVGRLGAKPMHDVIGETDNAPSVTGIAPTKDGWAFVLRNGVVRRYGRDSRGHYKRLGRDERLYSSVDTWSLDRDRHMAYSVVSNRLDSILTASWPFVANLADDVLPQPGSANTFAGSKWVSLWDVNQGVFWFEKGKEGALTYRLFGGLPQEDPAGQFEPIHS